MIIHRSIAIQITRYKLVYQVHTHHLPMLLLYQNVYKFQQVIALQLQDQLLHTPNAHREITANKVQLLLQHVHKVHTVLQDLQFLSNAKLVIIAVELVIALQMVNAQLDITVLKERSPRHQLMEPPEISAQKVIIA